MPIDINLLRAEKGGDPEYWRGVMRKRFKDVALVDRVIEQDQAWRKAQFAVEQARKEMGVIQKQVAEAKKAKDEATAETLIASMGAVKESIPGLEAAADAIKASLDKDLSKVPNDVSPGVPVSKDEADNAVVRTWGEPTPNPSGLNHHELLWMIGGYEPERGVGVAGHRAYFLTGVGALLNQALISYGLSYLSAKNYTALLPPFFMNRDVMAGVAQLEDFDEQLYKVVGEAADGSEDKYLIATSEQPICVFHKGEWLAEKELPKRYVGYSACFRKEAGSHGRDTWGIFRVHQFDKVEQFVVCEPEHSEAMHAAMIEASEGFYQSLGIAYRVINIVSGELNNAAAIKYDLEGWFPTQATFRELVSCSNCTDYQSRAMEVRCGLNKKAGPAGEPSKKYVHFLNGTLCATTRTICAILENNQTPEGVRVPEVLQPFLGGRTIFPYVREKPVSVEAKIAEKKEKKAAASAGGGGGGGGAPAAEATAAKPAAAQGPASTEAAASAPLPEAAEQRGKKQGAKEKGSDAAPPKQPAGARAPKPPQQHKQEQQGQEQHEVDKEALEKRLVVQPFIGGFVLSRKDLDQAAVVRHLNPSPQQFPAIHRWLRCVASLRQGERLALQ